MGRMKRSPDIDERPGKKRSAAGGRKTPGTGGKKGPGRKASGGREPEPVEKSKFGPDAKHFADAGIFLIIMIIGAVLAYALIPITFAEENTSVAQDLADLTTNINQVFMGSTIPETTYTNSDLVRTEYHNEKVYYLLSEDMYIRSEGKNDLNLANLRGGLEKNTGELAERLLVDGHGFLIMVTAPGQDGFVIVKTSKDSAISFEPSPGDKAVLDILGAKGGTSYHVESEYFMRNLETCTITFAMFESNSVDAAALQGGNLA